MRNICVVTIFVLSHLSLPAQLIDTIYTDWDIISGFFPRGDSSTIVVTSDGYIHFIDEKGSIEQTKRIEPVEEGDVGVHNVFIPFPPASDSFFYVSTFDNHCDYFLNFRLNKLDWNGDLIDYAEFDDWVFGDARFLFPSLPGLPLYMLIGGGFADLIYPEDSIRTLKVDDQLFKMHILDDGSFAFISDDSLYYYTWVQQQPILHNAIKLNIPNPWSIDIFSTSTFDILVKTSNRLSLYSEDLHLESDTIFPGGETIFFVEIKGDQIFVVSGIDSEFTRFHIFSSGLQLMKSFDLP